MKKYYFPAIGFGLFYQLGVLNNFPKEENCEIYGSSGGSIICMLSLLKEEDRNIDFLMRITNKIRKNLYFNLFPYLNHFIKEIFIILDSYENTYIERKLKTIYIEVTEINGWFHFKRKFIQPRNLSELKHYIIASCYIPFLFWSQSPFYYTINDKKYIDGFFANFSNVSNNFIKINSYSYASLIPPSEQKFRNDYQKGRKYNMTHKNTSLTIPIFIKMNLQIILDLILYIPVNIISIFQK